MAKCFDALTSRATWLASTELIRGATAMNYLKSYRAFINSNSFLSEHCKIKFSLIFGFKYAIYNWVSPSNQYKLIQYIPNNSYNFVIVLHINSLQFFELYMQKLPHFINCTGFTIQPPTAVRNFDKFNIL